MHKRRFFRRMLALGIAAFAVAKGSAMYREAADLRARQEALASVGMSIAPLYQYDYRETVCVVDGKSKSVASSGCGTTCLSMVLAYLTGGDAPSPQELFEEAYESGEYYGYGLTHEALDALAGEHGVKSAWIGRDAQKLRSALEQGYPVIAHMGPGQFTGEGHYILLRGLTDKGEVVLIDPNSEQHTWSAFSLEEILREAKTDEPFMVCARGG